MHGIAFIDQAFFVIQRFPLVVTPQVSRRRRRRRRVGWRIARRIAHQPQILPDVQHRAFAPTRTQEHGSAYPRLVLRDIASASAAAAATTILALRTRRRRGKFGRHDAMDAHRHTSVGGQLQELSRQDDHVRAGGMRGTIPPPLSSFVVVVAAIEGGGRTHPFAASQAGVFCPSLPRGDVFFIPRRAPHLESRQFRHGDQRQERGIDVSSECRATVVATGGLIGWFDVPYQTMVRVRDVILHHRFVSLFVTFLPTRGCSPPRASAVVYQLSRRMRIHTEHRRGDLCPYPEKYVHPPVRI